MTGRRVVVVGATGQIGRPLCLELIRRRDAVTVFSRDPARAAGQLPGAVGYLAWQPERLSPACQQALSAVDAVVYLAGGPLFDGRRHTRADIEAETRVRVGALARLVETLAAVRPRPAVLIAASSVGVYGFGPVTAEPIDESCPTGQDWWAADSLAIEQAALTAEAHGIRTVLLRTGYVLSAASITAQVRQFGRHLGGWIGTGRGFTPWIHLADEVSAICFALDTPAITGPINLTAPHPLRTRRFAQTLGAALGRRAWLPVPTPLARLGLGAVTDILVRGKPVVPVRLQQLGYRFQFCTARTALQQLCPHPGGRASSAPKTQPDTAAAGGRLSAVNLTACGLLLVQYLLGMAANLYAAPPAHHPGAGAENYFAGAAAGLGWVLAHGPGWLAAHAALGLALVVAELGNALMALRLRPRVYPALAGLAALAVFGAAFNGASFLNYGHDVSSMIMAGLWALALGCHLSVLGRLARAPSGPASRRRGGDHTANSAHAVR